MGEPAFGDQTVRVQGRAKERPQVCSERMNPGSAPGVFVLEQFHQGIAYRSKQQLSHRRGIEAPQRVKVMRDGKDKMTVDAIDQALLLSPQSAFDLNLITLT